MESHDKAMPVQRRDILQNMSLQFRSTESDLNNWLRKSQNFTTGLYVIVQPATTYWNWREFKILKLTLKSFWFPMWKIERVEPYSKLFVNI